MIDAHSHKVYNTETADAEGKEIPLVQTGAYFQNVGTMILHPDGTIDVNLLEEIPAPQDWMEGIEAVTVTRKDKERYVDAGMHRFLEDITAAYADVMNRKVGESAFDLIVRDEYGIDISRNSENGLCNLMADACREIGGTDIAIVNAGAVRNNLPAGEITFNTIMNVLPYSGNVLIAAVYGGVICGLGMGLLFLRDITTGGTDLLALLLKKIFPNVPSGAMLMCVDIAVVVIAVAIFRDIEVALTSAITIYVTSKVIDTLAQGVEYAKVIYVVTDKGAELSAVLNEHTARGNTLIKAVGGYTGAEKQLLITVTRRNVLSQTLHLIKQVDPAAFTFVTNSTEVHGEGFRVD